MFHKSNCIFSNHILEFNFLILVNTLFIHFISILKNRLILSIYISAKTLFAGHEAVELWGTRSERRTTRCYLRRRACRSTPRSTCRGTGGRSRRIFEENPLAYNIIVMKNCISSGLWNVLFVNLLFNWDILSSQERKNSELFEARQCDFLEAEMRRSKTRFSLATLHWGFSIRKAFF